MSTGTDDWVVGTLLLFAEGEPEGQLLHRGTRESCEEIATMLSAVSYSGARHVRAAYMPIMPASESIWTLPDPEAPEGKVANG